MTEKYEDFKKWFKEQTRFGFSDADTCYCAIPDADFVFECFEKNYRNNGDVK